MLLRRRNICTVLQGDNWFLQATRQVQVAPVLQLAAEDAALHNRVLRFGDVSTLPAKVWHVEIDTCTNGLDA